MKKIRYLFSSDYHLYKVIVRTEKEIKVDDKLQSISVLVEVQDVITKKSIQKRPRWEKGKYIWLEQDAKILSKTPDEAFLKGICDSPTIIDRMELELSLSYLKQIFISFDKHPELELKLLDKFMVSKKFRDVYNGENSYSTLLKQISPLF